MTHLRHQRTIFAVMHNGVRMQRRGNVRPLSLRTGFHEATRVQSPEALMPRTAISGLVCTTFLVLLVFPAVPQEPAGKGADPEAGPPTFKKASPTPPTTQERGKPFRPQPPQIRRKKTRSLSD